jgi:hypothetical protein
MQSNLDRIRDFTRAYDDKTGPLADRYFIWVGKSDRSIWHWMDVFLGVVAGWSASMAPGPLLGG